MTRSFVDAVLSGQAQLEDLHRYVAAWHANAAGQDKTLPAFLGLSQEEYTRWCWDEDAIVEIVAERRKATVVPAPLAGTRG